MQYLKQSTAATLKLGPFVDDADGKTAETSLTISQGDVRLSKNGGDMAQKNNASAATHDELGYYDVPLSTTDTDTLGRLRVMVSESGALPVWAEFMVLPAMIYDSLIGGSDRLDVNVTHVGDTAQTARDIGASVLLSPGTGAGQVQLSSGVVQANATQFAGQTITAAAGVTIPAELASPTNITAGTITTVSGNVTGSVGSIAAGGIASTSFASGAITAGVIATDAISSDEIAAAAVSEIQAGLSTLSSSAVAAAVWNASRASYVSAGSFGEGVPVGSLGAGSITNSTIADGAITSAKFTVAALTGVATGILEKIAQVWHWFFGSVELTDETMKTKTGDTVLTTQAVSYDGVTETRGAAE